MVYQLKYGANIVESLLFFVIYFNVFFDELLLIGYNFTIILIRPYFLK